MVLLSDLPIIEFSLLCDYYGQASSPEKVEPDGCIVGYSVVGPLYMIRKGPEFLDLNVVLLTVSWLGLLIKQNKKEKKNRIRLLCFIIVAFWYSKKSNQR